jgi:predicted phage terminase large subunit-like protein
MYHDRTEGDSPADASRIARTKAMDFYATNKVDMDQGAVVLWPERMNLMKLMEKRAERRLAFNSEYMNGPIDETTRVFHTIHFYKAEDLNLDECDIFGAVDPSMGQSKRSDPSAIISIATHRRSGIMYVIDVDIKRRHPDEIIQTIFRKARMLKYSLFSVETIAFQQFMKDEIVKRSAQQGIYLPVREFKSTVRKEIRIASIEPLLSSGQVRLLETQRDLIEELQYFPKAVHDDGSDVLSQCIQIAKKGTSSFLFSKL